MKQVLDNHGYSGIVASAGGVGMGGFVLGGGYGLQSRMYGLGIDNVVGMNVVLTNGQVKDVDSPVAGQVAARQHAVAHIDHII